jgi:hypothetical protein
MCGLQNTAGAAQLGFEVWVVSYPRLYVVYARAPFSDIVGFSGENCAGNEEGGWSGRRRQICDFVLDKTTKMSYVGFGPSEVWNASSVREMLWNSLLCCLRCGVARVAIWLVIRTCVSSTVWQMSVSMARCIAVHVRENICSSVGSVLAAILWRSVEFAVHVPPESTRSSGEELLWTICNELCWRACYG